MIKSSVQVCKSIFAREYFVDQQRNIEKCCQMPNSNIIEIHLDFFNTRIKLSTTVLCKQRPKQDILSELRVIFMTISESDMLTILLQKRCVGDRLVCPKHYSPSNFVGQMIMYHKIRIQFNCPQLST